MWASLQGIGSDLKIKSFFSILKDGLKSIGSAHNQCGSTSLAGSMRINVAIVNGKVCLPFILAVKKRVITRVADPFILVGSGLRLLSTGSDPSFFSQRSDHDLIPGFSRKLDLDLGKTHPDPQPRV